MSFQIVNCKVCGRQFNSAKLSECPACRGRSDDGSKNNVTTTASSTDRSLSESDLRIKVLESDIEQLRSWINELAKAIWIFIGLDFVAAFFYWQAFANVDPILCVYNETNCTTNNFFLGLSWLIAFCAVYLPITAVRRVAAETR